MRFTLRTLLVVSGIDYPSIVLRTFGVLQKKKKMCPDLRRMRDEKEEMGEGRSKREGKKLEKEGRET